MEKLNDNKKLIELLDKAEALASEFTGGYSGTFFSAEEFHLALSESIELFKQGDKTQIEKLHYWFLPTSRWDDFIRKDGIYLATEICEILNRMINKK